MMSRYRESVASDSVFDYDTRLGLDVQRISARHEVDVDVHDISYASPAGGRVPAYLVVPVGKGPFAGILAQHGMPGTRDRYLQHGIRLARCGAVVLLITAPFSRVENDHGDVPIRFTDQDRHEQVQLIIDLRRGADLLTERFDVDANRLAFTGRSYGAAIGGLLAGIETRLKAYVLSAGDGGLVAHFRDTGGKGTPLDDLSIEQRARWLQAMEPIEPIRFVGRAAPAALLFQAGLRDDAVSAENARAFQNAGSQPKEVRWYDAEHPLNEESLADQASWLERHIGIDAGRYHAAEN